MSTAVLSGDLIMAHIDKFSGRTETYICKSSFDSEVRIGGRYNSLRTSECQL